MGQITTNAIVLRRADYRENDRMLTLFSPTLGRIDALCRGCRRQKSPLMAASELFCSGEYVLYQARERTTVISCQIADSYYPLRADYERLSHGVYALELCGAAVQPALNTDLFGLAHAGVNYGLIALGMSAGSLLSYAGSQLLDLPARHMLAVASAVAGGICFLFVKPVATVEKQQGNG